MPDTTIDSGWVAVLPKESVTWTVKLNVPAEVTLDPDSTPAGDRDIPGGSDPEETAQVYGGFPPVARKTWVTYGKSSQVTGNACGATASNAPCENPNLGVVLEHPTEFFD